MQVNAMFAEPPLQHLQGNAAQVTYSSDAKECQGFLCFLPYSPQLLNGEWLEKLSYFTLWHNRQSIRFM